MTARTRRWLQLAVVALGAFFLVVNLAGGDVTPWDFIPLVGIACGLLAIELVRRNQQRGL